MLHECSGPASSNRMNATTPNATGIPIETGRRTKCERVVPGFTTTSENGANIELRMFGEKKEIL